MDATKFLIRKNDTTEPFYICGSSKEIYKYGTQFRIKFHGNDVTSSVKEGLEFKNKIKNGETIIENTSSRKKRKTRKTHVEKVKEKKKEEDLEDLDIPEDMEREESFTNIFRSESNITETFGSDLEKSSISDALEESSLEQKEPLDEESSGPKDDENSCPGGSLDIYDQDDDEEVPMKIVKKAKGKRKVIEDEDAQIQEDLNAIFCSEDTQQPFIDESSPKPRKARSKPFSLSSILLASKSETSCREYVLTGSLAEAICSPLNYFILKIEKNKWTTSNDADTFNVLEIIKADVPSSVSYVFLYKKSKLCGIFGDFVEGVKKMKKELGFERKDLSNSRKVDKFAELEKVESKNREIAKAVKQALEPFKKKYGTDDGKVLLSDETTSCITDEKMKIMLCNIFKDKRYFRTLSILGIETCKAIGDNILGRLGLLSKLTTETMALSFSDVVDTIKEFVLRTEITRPMLEYIITRNIKFMTTGIPPEEIVERTINCLCEASAIMKEYKSNCALFQDTSIREKVDKRWSQDVIDFFEEQSNMTSGYVSHYTYISSTSVDSNNTHQVLHGITLKKVFTLEKEISIKLASLKKCVLYTTKCDDGDLNTPYFSEMSNIINEHECNVVLLTACERRLNFLTGLFGRKIQVKMIAQAKYVKSPKIDTVIIDRAHKISLPGLKIILGATINRTMTPEPIFKNLYLFGNKDIFPFVEGHVFTDICDSGVYRLNEIGMQYNLKKVVPTIRSFEELKEFLTEHNFNRRFLIFNNVKDKNDAIEAELRKNSGGFSGLGISHNNYKAITQIDERYEKDAIIADMVVYVLDKKTNNNHVSKLFDITTREVEKPSIVFYSPEGINFETTKDARRRCTSFGEMIKKLRD